METMKHAGQHDNSISIEFDAGVKWAASRIKSGLDSITTEFIVKPTELNRWVALNGQFPVWSTVDSLVAFRCSCVHLWLSFCNCRLVSDVMILCAVINSSLSLPSPPTPPTSINNSIRHFLICVLLGTFSEGFSGCSFFGRHGSLF